MFINMTMKDCQTEEKKQDKVPTDDREIGDWKPRYEETALRNIKWERNYLLIVICFMALISIALGIQVKNQILNFEFAVSPKVHSYFFAWIGGTFGGLVFAGKWLYHTVARGYWNLDRRLWRILTPHLSGIVALFFVMIFSSDIFNNPQTYSIHKSCGIGFLVGYFSDNAIGKLSELANVFFAKNG